MENISLGSFIKNARLAKGYYQMELSNLSGVAVSTISMIETGKSRPQLSTLKSICSALNLDYEETLKRFSYIKEGSKENALSLGEFIKNVRKSKGYSIEYLSTLSEVSNPQISNIETGKTRTPRLYTLRRICSALDIDFGKAVELRAKSL